MLTRMVLALASLATSALQGCSLVVGDGTRVLATGDAGSVVESGSEIAADASVDTGTDARTGDADSGSTHPAADAQVDSAPVCTSGCPVGERCSSDGECVTHVCTGGLCVSCSPLCSDGYACMSNQDCASQRCQNGVCEPPSCATTPAKCNDSAFCGADADCGSQACVAGRCSAPSCAPFCGHGSPCGSNNDCGPPRMCENGSCK